MKEEKEMLETRSMPLRNYLMKHVMPTLTEGLIEACKVKPDDPVDYLVSDVHNLNEQKKPTAIYILFCFQAEYLFKHNPQVD